MREQGLSSEGCSDKMKTLRSDKRRHQGGHDQVSVSPPVVQVPQWVEIGEVRKLSKLSLLQNGDNGTDDLMHSPSPVEECAQNHKKNIPEACCLLHHRAISAVYLSSN